MARVWEGGGLKEIIFKGSKENAIVSLFCRGIIFSLSSISISDF